jgi:hypothetical protein
MSTVARLINVYRSPGNLTLAASSERWFTVGGVPVPRFDNRPRYWDVFALPDPRPPDTFFTPEPADLEVVAVRIQNPGYGVPNSTLAYLVRNHRPHASEFYRVAISVE